MAKNALSRINKSTEHQEQAVLEDCLTVLVNEKKINDRVSEITDVLNNIIKNVVAYDEVEKDFKEFTDEWYNYKINLTDNKS